MSYELYIAIVITIMAAHTLWIKYRPQGKQRYFNKLLKDIELQIWDEEFTRFKTKEAREALRVDYDAAKARLETLKVNMKLNDEEKTAEKLSTDDRKRMDDDKVLLERDIVRMEQGRAEGDPADYIFNLKDFDHNIKVANSKIDQLQSLKLLVRDYIRSI